MNDVTKRDVVAAADILASQGEMPGARNVREALGNRGSMATINKYLKEWKIQLLQKNTTACVFCDAAEQQAQHFKNIIEQHREAADMIRSTLQSMLKGHDHKESFLEIINTLQ